MTGQDVWLLPGWQEVFAPHLTHIPGGAIQVAEVLRSWNGEEAFYPKDGEKFLLLEYTLAHSCAQR